MSSQRRRPMARGPKNADMIVVPWVTGSGVKGANDGLAMNSLEVFEVIESHEITATAAKVLREVKIPIVVRRGRALGNVVSVRDRKGLATLE